MLLASSLLCLLPVLVAGNQHVIKYLTVRVTNEITTTRYITTFLPASTTRVTKTVTSTKTAISALPEVAETVITDDDATVTLKPMTATDLRPVTTTKNRDSNPLTNPRESKAITTTVTNTLIVTALSSAATAEPITPITPSEPSPPYVRWAGRVPDPNNGTVITVNPIGIDDLYEKLKSEYPDRGNTIQDYGDDYNTTSWEPEEESTHANRCRSDTPPFDPDVIKKHAQRLREVGGSWVIESQGCHRLSCEKNSAIWWCSDVMNRPVNNKIENRKPRNLTQGVANGSDLYHVAMRITQQCWDEQDKIHHHGGYQWFSPSDVDSGYTVVYLGYGVCTDATSDHPYKYLYNGTDGVYGGGW
ncbi:hypothetical protein QBC44DRAFT_391126 [Cladorrhinum sp. PSN332]|nr:hypothetical protein QBC44DRAFT_391126 [Cladorrhinum sp. PSN332]